MFSQIKIAPKHIPNEQKDDDDYKQISEEPNELEKGKLPPEEILSLPMFKVSDLISLDAFR